MSKKFFVWLLATFLPTTVSLADAQQAAKVPRIGYLHGGSTRRGIYHNDFFQGLRELSYVEGKNILIEYGLAERKLDRLPVVAAELVGLKVDIIVAAGGHRTSPGCQESDQDNPHRLYISRRSHQCRSC